LHVPALVVGSMVPDLGYYVPVSRYFKADNHTLPHLFTFCVPLGIVVLAVCVVLRRGFVFALPEPHRSALAQAPPLVSRVSWAIPLSLLIGAITHVAWDRLTDHDTRYRLLEVLSSVIGLAAIAGVYLAWLRRQPRHASTRADLWRYGAWLAVIAGGLAVTRAWGRRLYHYNTYTDMRLSVLDSLATLVACTLSVALLLVCVCAVFARVDARERIS
jgi:hypothetical protein